MPESYLVNNILCEFSPTHLSFFIQQIARPLLNFPHLYRLKESAQVPEVVNKRILYKFAMESSPIEVINMEGGQYVDVPSSEELLYFLFIACQTE